MIFSKYMKKFSNAIVNKRLYQIDKKNDTRNLELISKYLSLIPRHKPETIGITLDEHG